MHSVLEQEINNEGRIAGRFGGSPVPVAVEALRKLLRDFNARTGARMSAIVSRSGVPVAWALPGDVQVDNFATMAATLLGALEVIYSTLKAKAPSRIKVESESGVLVVREVTGKMFFVALTEKQSLPLTQAIEETLTKARDLLGEA